MGIQALESYLLKFHPKACPRVKIGQMVSEYRAETGRTEAVGVIDTNILLRQCLEDQDIVCGGQFQEYRESLLRYASNLEALGITPVFFLDGAIEDGKMRCWLERKDEKLERIARTYRLIAEGTNCSPLRREDCVIPAGLYECAILALKEEGYQVFCAVNESDVEIARYARMHGCFGIFSRDTDFVILSGARYYFSLFHKHFRASDMSTILFDREAVARALGLHPDHLPLLASLLHNDYVDNSYLMPLYNKMRPRRSTELDPKERYSMEELVPGLVSWIRGELFRSDDPVQHILDKTFNGYPPFLVRRLAHKMGLKDHLDMRERLRLQLEVSLSMYEYSPKQPVLRLRSPQPQPETDVDLDVLEQATARHKDLRFLSSAALSLLRRRVYDMGPALEDPALGASSPAATSVTAIQPFRRRVYGLLRVPGPFTERVVPVICDGKPFVPAVVEATSPDPSLIAHPGLLSLWRTDDDGGAEVADERWSLFAWALTAHRPPEARSDALATRLRTLPPHLVAPTAVTYLLVHSGALEAVERSHAVGDGPVLRRTAGELVRRLVRTFLLAPHLRADELRALRVARYERLEVHVAALFMRTFTFLTVLNDVLGAPIPQEKLNPAFFFDGKLFHFVFSDLPLDEPRFDKDMEKSILDTIYEDVEEIEVEE